jgi:hypothetical protein
MIIGLCGPKNSGKSELARALNLAYADRIAFAEAGKQMLSVLLEYQGLRNGHIRRMLYGDLKEIASPLLNDHTPRFAMQTLMGDWGRNIMGEDNWINVWIRRTRNRTNVVVEDLRHSNEAKAIRHMGGKIIEVRRLGVEYTGEHESEMANIEPDFTIINDRTVKEMFETVERLLNP